MKSKTGRKEFQEFNLHQIYSTKRDVQERHEITLKNSLNLKDTSHQNYFLNQKFKKVENGNEDENLGKSLLSNDYMPFLKKISSK